ncbi:MAG: Stp1/IreP family PP2C-type Ser/Thr phosphatase [SAR324 cluster bacterium]|nr:Stp1/IreP family PP2C-type Ser/Thr phosphatase [SAR324 cluster bacterium]
MRSTKIPIQLDPQAYDDLPFNWSVQSDIGRVRQTNEDSYLIEPETGLFIVSDGMGGHRGGELASSFVTSDLSVTIDTELNKLRSSKPRAIRRIIQRAIYQHNKQVQMEGQSEAGYKDMGATVVLALIRSGRVTIANLGDSRLYRYRNGTLIQISRDHSIIAELIEKGKLLPEHAENHDDEGIITQYMGMEDKAVPHIKSFLLKKNDRLLLCTDGLTDMLTDSQIQDVLRTQPDADIAAKQLVKLANDAGGMDNITVLLIDWKDTTS